MPLQGPGHFKENVRTLMHEVGKSPHVQSREQALAIAYAKERGHAEGGLVGYQAGGEVGGLVDHDRDPELPRTPESARLIPMLPLPSGYRDPAYLSVIQRLIEGQRRLNAMNPVARENLRRYWAGGLVRHFRLGGSVGRR
jgi:hypothetical protein